MEDFFQIVFPESQTNHMERFPFAPTINVIELFLQVFELIRFEIVYKFVKTAWHKFRRINKANFVFEFLVFVVNTFRETYMFLLIVRDTVNLTLCFPKILDEEMWVITWKVMKYHRHMFRFSEKQVPFIMSCSSELPGKVTMIFSFSSISTKMSATFSSSLVFVNKIGFEDLSRHFTWMTVHAFGKLLWSFCQDSVDLSQSVLWMAQSRYKPQLALSSNACGFWTPRLNPFLGEQSSLHHDSGNFLHAFPKLSRLENDWDISEKSQSPHDVLRFALTLVSTN